jgi:hypothetical protein
MSLDTVLVRTALPRLLYMQHNITLLPIKSYKALHNWSKKRGKYFADDEEVEM